MILAGDIGGTKTNLALFPLKGGQRTLIAERSFRSGDYAGLEAVVREFLTGRAGEVASACFGVPCPVVEGTCKMPNLLWVLDVRALKHALKIGRVSLINDLEATAYGIAALETEEFAVLNEGHLRPQGNSAVIAAGTGLGEAILSWNGKYHVPTASEGGHADFAPRNPMEIDLLQYLLAKFGHVSYERVISGPGLFNIYSFLKDAGYGEEPGWLAERMRQEDPSAVISEAALAEQCELCVKALALFVSLYGAEAGNLALKVMATGGVYVGGGIAPKIIKKLKDGTFVKAFTDKGRLSPLLAGIPVRVILNDETALYGAARYATLEE
jgi:glucokinase